MKVTNSPGPKKKVTFKTRPDIDKNVLNPWWLEKTGDGRAAQMLTTAAYLKESQAYRYRQAAIFARLYGNQSLYSFAGNNIAKIDNDHGLPQDRPTFNLVQSVTDTLVSRLSQARPQPVFLTDNGDYKQRNLAKKLNNFAQGEFYQVKAYEKAAVILRDTLVEGTIGVAHIYETPLTIRSDWSGYSLPSYSSILTRQSTVSQDSSTASSSTIATSLRLTSRI